MAATVVIPARFGSTRFPPKILASETGLPLVQHVVERVRRNARVREVIVATDDDRIYAALGAVRHAGRHDLAEPPERSYQNFILKARFKFLHGNSGILFRATAASPDGYEADIYPGAMGKLALSDKVLVRPTAEVQRKLLKVDDWNDYVITADGDRIRLTLNGVNVVDSSQHGPQEGYLRLQLFGADVATDVRFKDIYIQELPTTKSADLRK